MKTKLITTWSRAVDLFLDFIVGTFWVTLFLALIATGIPLILLAGLGVLLLLGTAALTRVSGSAERHRAMALHNVAIEAPHRRRTTRTDWLRPFAQGLTDMTDPVTWRTLAHHLITMLVGSGMLLILAGGIGLLEWLTLSANAGTVSWAMPVAAGLAALLLLVLYVAYIGRLDEAASVALLGPSRSAALAGQVNQLAQARKGAVSAADTERRRFERDLHDGVQPRLVSTAMTLGMAKHRFDEDPQGARQLLDEAHEEIKESITELRHLARGMHPAVLTDRGLDAALSAVASRSPVPVRLEVNLAGRLDGETEAVLYFVVAEALTNVAKHSGATSAQVQVNRRDGAVCGRITDNGRGSAYVTPGGGLSGIGDRVRSAGGTFTLTSPEGGPTEIEVLVPCES
ncbi:sensor histidine kinase [Pseudactinotalea sp. Z1732]|uniref:sensor histidine kinase n=1 Tax=Pseudactinotalea sp. Z1732 TaxID=3413026 RepID=UPI003C7C2F4C